MLIKEFKKIQKDAGFSNAELARYLGVTDVQVRNYLSGRRDILMRTKNQMLILDVLCKFRSNCSYEEMSETIEKLLKELSEKP